jgi:hypothetical protein
LDATPAKRIDMPTYHLIADPDDFNDTIDDVDDSAFNYIWNRRRVLFLAICLVSAVLFAGILYLEVSHDAHDARGPQPVYPLIAFALPIGFYLLVRARLQHVFMQQIAGAIGFRYQPTGSLRGLGGKFFQLGTSPEIEDVLCGVYRGRPIEIFNYSFTIQQGRSSHTEHYTIFALTVDGVLPDIALTPRSFLIADSIASAPDADVEITLEGDFNKYFHLYAPKAFDVEIRVIFQPDLMMELIEKYQSYRIEIASSRLYVVSPLICNKAKFLAAHDLIDRLFDHMVPNLKEVAIVPAVDGLTAGSPASPPHWNWTERFLAWVGGETKKPN